MMFRVLKSLLVLCVGLNALIFALQNVANLNEVYSEMAYVISGAGHKAYPHTFFFYSNAPVLVWTSLVVVLLLEFAIALFGLKGAWDLLSARNDSREQFHEAKRAGAWAGGLAILTWFGMFVVVGGAFFQMWQTEAGLGSLQDAFELATISAVTVLFVYLTDD
jgi:predicted small integral membrane protein